MKRLRNDAASEVDLGWMGALNRAIRWCLFIGIIGFIIAQYLPLIRKNQALRENVARWETQQARLTDRPTIRPLACKAFVKIPGPWSAPRVNACNWPAPMRV